MDGKQLKQVILNHYAKSEPDLDPEDAYSDSHYEGFFDEPTEVSANVVTIEPVDFQYGGEGKSGQEMYHILRVTTDGGDAQYFKLSGTYFSHGASEWNDEWVEVKPKEKKVTVWE